MMGGLIEPIKNGEQFEWFNRLHPRWQVWFVASILFVCNILAKYWFRRAVCSSCLVHSDVVFQVTIAALVDLLTRFEWV